MYVCKRGCAWGRRCCDSLVLPAVCMCAAHIRSFLCGVSNALFSVLLHFLQNTLEKQASFVPPSGSSERQTWLPMKIINLCYPHLLWVNFEPRKWVFGDDIPAAGNQDSFTESYVFATWRQALQSSCTQLEASFSFLFFFLIPEMKKKRGRGCRDQLMDHWCGPVSNDKSC